MLIDTKLLDIIKKVEDGLYPDKDEILYLLKVEKHSIEAGIIIGYADRINRKTSNNKAEVHAQIGLNLSPCPNNCTFCAFAAKNKVFKEKNELSIDDAVKMALAAEKQGANALFLMGTGDYPFEKFIEVSQEIKFKIKPDTVIIANIGDFNENEAKKLKDTGYIGIYHAIRMGEGVETQIDPKTRLKTINIAKENGLLIGTCVEPIGPEHSIEEIADKIIIGREMHPCYSGAMRRINIPGSDMEKYGMIDEYQMAFFVAVVRISMGNKLIANCTHEPNTLGATTGANLFWAEVGTNPRDTEAETSEGRGADIFVCKQMLKEADWEIVEGPSQIYSEDNII